MNIKNKKTMSMTEENPLGYAPVTGLIRKFAIPSIISLLVSAAYNITDQIFIGHIVGMLGNAATNVAFPVSTLTHALSQLIGIGTAANFNLSQGAKKQDDAEQFIGTGLALMSCCGILMMAIVLIFRTPILMLCGATENVLPYAQLYLSITAFGIPFFLFSQASNQLIRADGSPSYSMLCTVSGAVLNVVLDWLFMFIFGWGIQGAAAATVIGQVVSFALCVRYFPRFKAFKIRFALLRVKLHYLIGIARLGVSNFIIHGVLTVVNIILNNTLTFYGAQEAYGSDIPLAVAGVVTKLYSIFTACTVGLAHGCLPILSFNMGAKNYSRIRETYKKAILTVIAIGLVFFLSFQLFPRQIISIFGSGDELYYEFAARYLRIYMMMVCVLGVQFVSVNYFSGIGYMRQSIILSASRHGLLLIPLLIILPMIFGLDGVLYAGPIADSLSCVLSLFLVSRSFKRFSRLEQEA